MALGISCNKLFGTVSVNTLQGWLNAGDVSGSYSSFADVEADEAAVRKLMTKHASVDFLTAHSTDPLISQIINSDICAKWINLRDYALDTLSANSDIKALMDTADKYGYGEWALMPQVPKMTSNTAPYGVASASSANSGYEAYKAFDGVMGTSGGNRWSTVASDTNKWLQYQFVSPIKISQIVIYPRHNVTYNITVKGSNDGTAFDDLTTFEITGDGLDDYNKKFTIDIPENKQATYSYYRLSFDIPAGNSAIVGELQFYAWQPKGNVPVMTSNTAPYGEASASSAYSGYPAWKAFDGTNVYWSTASAGTSDWIQYKFTTPVNVRKLSIMRYIASNTDFSTFKLYGGNDVSDLHEIGTYNLTAVEDYTTEEVEIENDQYYLIYRLTSTAGAGKYSAIRRLQFYGRELSVSVPTMTSNTAPWGEVLSSTPYTDMEGYKAFNKVTTDSWGNVSRSEYGYVGFRFPHPVKITRFDVFQRTIAGGSYNGATESFKLQASNDGTTWADISELIENWVCVVTRGAKNFAFDADPLQAYRYYRLYVSPATMDLFPTLAELQFYGFDYSEREFAEGYTMKYIYDHGVELEALTDYIAEGSIEHGSDYIEVSGGNVIENNTTPIDLTLYNTMRMIIRDVYERGSTYYPYLRADTAPAGTSGTMLAFANIENSMLPNNISLDISSISQTAYIYSGYYKMATSESAKWRIHEWWLE